MSFASVYFSRFRVQEPIITEVPSSELGIIVTIPCHNEPDILETLQSLAHCIPPPCKTEVIVVVNNSEKAPNEIVYINNVTYNNIVQYINHFNTEFIRLHCVYVPNMSYKHAGVGFARKIAMDEATHRFAYTNNHKGIIASLDADCTVHQSYLLSIYQTFTSYDCGIAPIYFEHPLSGNLSYYQYFAIAQYELYLRWYVYMLRSIGFPFAHHTVGSSFAVRADAYCRQGGMNKRQAGEDFYFLQKMYEAEQVSSITNTTVYPSARVSHRVPFGTGYAMQTLMNSADNIYYVYNPYSFYPLNDFFTRINELYKCNSERCIQFYKSLHYTIQLYVSLEVFEAKILECNTHSLSKDFFVKRFFLWFNGFMIFKYLNFVHTKGFFEKISIQHAASQTLELDSNVFELLKMYRKIDRNR